MMTKSAQTVFFFAWYLFLLGGALLTVPNLVLGGFGLPPVTDVYIRVAGMLTVLIGVYYVVAAKSNSLPLLQVTVKTRLAVPVFLAAFVLLGYAPPTLLLFGGPDILGALWTHFALRSDLSGKAAR